MSVETDGVEPDDVSRSADELFATGAADEAIAPEPPASTQGAAKQILVVDDSKMMRFAICELLEKMGHIAIEAAGSIEGYEKAMETSPDLILLDIEMPVQNGIELLIELRKTEKHKTTPVIILTVSGDRYDIEAANALNVADYMLKPPVPDKLKSSIAKVLNIPH